jgi:hypothetical protein
MSISLICSGNPPPLREILRTALARSFTHSQVECVAFKEWEDAVIKLQSLALVIASAQDDWAEKILRSLEIPGSKILLLGRIPSGLASYFDLTTAPISDHLSESVACEKAPPYQYSQSKAVIRYREASPLGISSPIVERPCLRYDFMDEWNNLGYGAIRADGSIWSIAQLVQTNEENTLAHVEVEGRTVSSYAALWNTGHSSLLWFNRPVGPVDSQEWRLVERYFSSFSFPQALCLPVPSEIPAGFDAAVTMRLDCDEDIASAQDLFDFYQSERVPFSLALKTSLLSEQKHLPLLRAVVASGGSILSHSATHPSQWGGNYEVARTEASTSRATITQALGTEARLDYAVSPFHQNPLFAVKALADSGFAGFIGGIICNDPEYLLARGGEVLGGPHGFVHHSQQCMLHGECLLAQGDPLAIFKQSFEITRGGQALFGYLDHPFSDRYQYGWESAAHRIRSHQDFLHHIRSAGKVIFLSENQALDWLRFKSALSVERCGTQEWRFRSENTLCLGYNFMVEYGGDHFTLNSFAE